MLRTTILLLLMAGAVGLIALAGPLPAARSASAQIPKAHPQWEYAHLVLGDTAADVHWQAGSTTLGSAGDVKSPDPARGIGEVYRQLGGKEPKPTLGVLLDQIGQDGWEMVTYVRPPGVQTWMFKRARP